MLVLACMSYSATVTVALTAHMCAAAGLEKTLDATVC